jgi:hypothetical protein
MTLPLPVAVACISTLAVDSSEFALADWLDVLPLLAGVLDDVAFPPLFPPSCEPMMATITMTINQNQNLL